MKARQRLGAFLLRHGRVYREGKSRWTQKYFRWLEEQKKFAPPVQQVVFQEYVDTVVEARRRVAGLEEQMRTSVPQWSLRPVVEGLMALRGVEWVTAMRLRYGRVRPMSRKATSRIWSRVSDSRTLCLPAHSRT